MLEVLCGSLVPWPGPYVPVELSTAKGQVCSPERGVGEGPGDEARLAIK